MFRRALMMLMALALLAAACSAGEGNATVEPPERDAPDVSVLPPADPDGPGGDPGPEGEQAAPENPDDGRLVVQHADGQLSTMLPDGTDVVELTEAGSNNSQAAWAPDGSRVAWVAEDMATGEISLALDRFDRSDFREIEVDDRPFYLYWDPSASKVAHLAATPAGVDLWVAEPFAEDGAINRRIDRGEPFFFSWGPDGDELLVHASGFRLDRIDLGSQTRIIDEFPAPFGAPAWLPDDSLLFADIDEDEQFLISTGGSGEGRRPLITFDGTLRFAVNNDGNRIVMQALPGEDDDPVVTASAELFDPDDVEFTVAQTDPTPTPEFDDSLDAIERIEPFVPYVMGTFGGEPIPLSSSPALAIFPSPDGQATAWYEAAPGVRGSVILTIDSGNAIFTTQPFIPSQVMLDDYLPFFDQYELSHDFWSPSSNLFVYAGRQPGDATDGIWVLDRSTGDITRIADGVVASFTRTPQASGAASAL